MSAYNIFDMASGEELGRYFAHSASDALNAMARTAGYEDFAAACAALPTFRDRLFITEL